MQFINPIWLWGFTGLVIPLGIHLLSRKESRIIRIGSIRHLETSHSKQSLNLRLNELLLLAIRCLLVILLTLLLSGLYFNTDQRNASWLLVERGMETHEELQPLQDSLAKQGFEVRYLEQGFPIPGSAPKSSDAGYWSLVESLRGMPLDKIVVLSYSYAERFRGKRVDLPANITWLSIMPPPSRFSLSAIRSSPDSVLVREGSSSAEETTFALAAYPAGLSKTFFKMESETDSVAIGTPDTVSVAIMSDPEFRNDEQILTASLLALEESLPVVFDIQRIKSDQPPLKTDWTIWLSLINPPPFPQSNLILFGKSGLPAKDLFERKNTAAGTWLITKRLNEQVALERNLPLKLARLLLSQEKTESRANAFDRRVQPEQQLWSEVPRTVKSGIGTIEPTPTLRYLAVLICMVLLAERLLAMKRNQ